MIEAGVIPYPWIVEYIWFAKPNQRNQLCYNSWHRLNRFIWESPIDISLQVARQKLESWQYLSSTQPAGLECFYRKLEGDDEGGEGNRWRLVMAMVTRSSTVVALGGGFNLVGLPMVRPLSSTVVPFHWSGFLSQTGISCMSTRIFSSRRAAECLNPLHVDNLAREIERY